MRNSIKNETVDGTPNMRMVEENISTNVEESLTPFCPSGSIEAKVEVMTDYYYSETSWDIKNAVTNEIVESRDSFPSQNSLHEDTVYLPLTETCEGIDYIFTISDSFGDGICCGHGDGYYKVLVDGVVLAEGGDFEYSESTSLCRSTEVKVEIMTDYYYSETSWDIKNAVTNEIVESRDSFPSQNSLHEDTVYLPLTETCEGIDYIFTISDSFGDGICCGHGDGYYKVLVDGVVLAEGGDFKYSESTSLCHSTNYSFVQGKDSHGNDIERYWFEGITIDQMKSRCDANVECLGFNSNGWMKYHLKPENEWVHWTNDPNKGFYIKE